MYGVCVLVNVFQYCGLLGLTEEQVLLIVGPLGLLSQLAVLEKKCYEILE